MSSETLAEMHERHAREIAAIEKPGAPTYSHLLDDVEILTGDVRRRDELIQALRTRLAESEAEVENQRRLRMMAEEAIPKGVEVACYYFAAEIQTLRTRLAESEAEVGRLTRSCDGWQEDARLYARNAADWEAKCHAAEAERDDLLGALREVVEQVDGLQFHRDEAGVVTVQNISTVEEWATAIEVLDRARAAIDKVGGK